VQDTIAARTDYMISTVAVIEPFVKSGKMRWLSISGAKRNPLVPEIPTMAETVPGLTVDAVGFTLVAPSATPTDIIQRLNKSLQGLLADPEFVKQIAAFGLPTAPPNTPDEANADLREQRVTWGKIFQDFNIQPQ
jgi:tripartite-type tricarboxylate transporter receptor subunit TctC